MSEDELVILERRREALLDEADELARKTQTERMHVLLRPRDGSLAVVLCLVLALGLGIVAGAIWLPTIRLYTVVCR